MTSYSDDNDLSGDHTDDEQDNYDEFDFDCNDQFGEPDYDLDNDHSFDDLFQSCIEHSTELNLVDAQNIRLAIDQFAPAPRANQNAFGDLIDSYLERPSFIQAMRSSLAPFSLSLQATDLAPSATQVPKDRLFVLDVAQGSNSEELRRFLQSLGYQDILNVHVGYKPNRKPGFAFIDCRTEKTAQDILYDFARQPEKFTFRHLRLRIVLNEKDPSARKTSRPMQTLEDGTSSIAAFPVQCSGNLPTILHGTLIAPCAMRNIAANSEHDSNLGCIVQHLLDDSGVSYAATFEIDQGLKKIALVLTGRAVSTRSSDTVRSVRFEWHFRDLKGDRISPVLTGHDPSRTSKIDATLYMLIEVKRPPMIIHVEKFGGALAQRPPRETRLPGNNFIGHANAWLFQLDPSQDIYFRLFQILRRYNLCQQPLFENNIIHFISPGQAVPRVRHVQLLSNEAWMKEHRSSVDRFLQERWSRYPFETKFEIMKLISKHIVTVHDLIVDESTLDRILAKCSLKTFTACADKIIEFAARWISTSDNDEAEGDEEAEEEEGQTAFSSQTSITTAVSSLTLDSSEASQVMFTKRLLSASGLGSLSRLLLLAINELKRRHEIVLSTDNIYVTRHELRKEKIDSLLIRKIYITPSSFLYEGPYTEEKCRVTRHYESEQDCFLRIAFRDEDYSKLRNADTGMTNLYERINMILKRGVVLCDRQYSFLAFSSSQLREHSCWMFYSRLSGRTTVDTIRSWMGTFENIYPVAKYAARLGQSFSTTTKGSDFQADHFDVLPDEKSSTGQLYTDGIGIITRELAAELAEKMKLQRVPSAFQIRCGGFKGLLLVNNVSTVENPHSRLFENTALLYRLGMVCIDVASRIKKANIRACFRESMNKFASHNLSIDIVRVSHNAPAFLNRQIILLLSSLGIGDHVFLSLQRRMVEKVFAVTEDATRAEEVLQEMNGEHGGNGTHHFMIEYLRRFGLKTDPLVRQMLLCFQAYYLKELRTKARIFVQDGCCLLGVVDESKTLRYGQVFIQIEQISGQHARSQILEGPVIVTRNPCFHPGDIRRLQAVNLPCLHDLKNVIVFPCQGSASHPNEMSGGDLDGDSYWISTNPQLIFDRNESPLDYEDQAIKALKQAQLAEKKKYTIDDVCDFFAEYIKADNLGFIANSHLAFADQLPHGAKNDTCIKLARMHSVAVDFAKNGVHAEALSRDLRPNTYPHFMEKRDKQAYPSKTILGQLYNEAEKVKVDLPCQERQNIDKFPYSDLLIAGDLAYVEDARSIRQEYNRDLKRIMRQYGIRREGELLSGYILKFTSRQYAKQAKAFEIRNELGHAIRVMRDKYIRYFWQEFYQSADDAEESSQRLWQTVSRKLTWRNQLELAEKHSKYSIEVEKKASAWYRVTYEQLVTRLMRRDQTIRMNGDLFSFAWIAYPVLFRIADEQTQWSSLIANEDKAKRNKKRRRRRRNRKRY